MSQFLEVKVPDIGDYKDVPVIEVYVQSGESVEAEQSLMTLESDKATIDVPSPAAGIVKEIRLKAGDTVSEGALILLLEPAVNGAQTLTLHRKRPRLQKLQQQNRLRPYPPLFRPRLRQSRSALHRRLRLQPRPPSRRTRAQPVMPVPLCANSRIPSAWTLAAFKAAARRGVLRTTM